MQAHLIANSHHYLPSYLALEFFPSSCWLTSPSAFSTFMQNAITFQNMTNPLVFPVLNAQLIQYAANAKKTAKSKENAM